MRMIDFMTEKNKTFLLRMNALITSKSSLVPLVLQCVTVCCSVLQCVAVWRSVLQYGAECCSVMQSVAVYCSVSQCVAVC